ncbi:hypothetical protein MN091_20050 [Xanthomonas euvesicatoria]|nr:hypothetical protein [Xanthomonas euvesicatoria]MDH4909809.1 hypothetical protein [Xanthomonas euvesicatoria]
MNYKANLTSVPDTNTAPKQQAIWLDDLPVGLMANGAQLHYIEPDHLGSPRVLFSGSAQVVNKTAIKPRGGVAGGGPSGRYTSYSRRYLGNWIGRTIGRFGGENSG